MTYSAPKSSFSREIYVQGLTGIKPQTTQYSVLHDQAKSILEKSQLGLASYNYVQGGASSGKTMRNNLSAFDEFSILPKMLNGVQLEDFKTEIKLFGKSISAPLLVCPIGVQAQLHKDADLATSSAVSQIGIPYSESAISEEDPGLRLSLIPASCSSFSSSLLSCILSIRRGCFQRRLCFHWNSSLLSTLLAIRR